MKGALWGCDENYHACMLARRLFSCFSGLVSRGLMTVGLKMTSCSDACYVLSEHRGNLIVAVLK